MNEQIAFKCVECKKVNIFPKHKQDGNHCINCGGYLVPIGDVATKAITKEQKKDIYINVEAQGLNEIKNTLENANKCAESFLEAMEKIANIFNTPPSKQNAF